MSLIDASQLEMAVQTLREGGVVVFPTETSYGLGADATNAQAVQRLIAIKGRESWKTPPLIAADRAMVDRETIITPTLGAHADVFWPGPLTLVVPVRAETNLCSEVVREGTVAIRVSSDQVAQQLSAGLGAPIVATSANLAGQQTCYDIVAAKRQFQTQLLQPDLYLDDGPRSSRPASTIMTEQNGEVVILRQGEIVIPKPYVA